MGGLGTPGFTPMMEKAPCGPFSFCEGRCGLRWHIALQHTTVHVGRQGTGLNRLSLSDGLEL